MAEIEIPSCDNCRFFVPEPDVTGGTCRLNPPVVVSERAFGVWPTVFQKDWCGKHKADSSG